MKENVVASALVSQYKAALQMLRAVIVATPAEVWDGDEYENPTWRLAYHILWGARYYLAASPEAFTPWEGAIEGAESLGGWWEGGEAVAIEDVHTPDELVAFLDTLLEELPEAVTALPLDGDSGFEWYPYSRLELHLNSIRHIQHHTGQLIERLRSGGVTGFAWARFGGDDGAAW